MPLEKVTLVTTSFPVGARSVSGIFVAHLAHELSKFVELTVVTPADTASAGRFRRQSVTVVTCRYAPKRWQYLAHAPGGIPVALKNNRWLYLWLPGMLLSLFTSSAREALSSSVIHANWAVCGCLAGVLGRMLGKPVVTTLRGEDVTRAGCSTIDRLLLRTCLRLSNRVVSVSQDMRNWLVENFLQYADKLVLIENGVDEAFLVVGAQRNHGNPPRAIHLITVGSLIPRKGVDQILRALAQLEGVRPTLSVVGAGPEERALTDMAKSLGLTERVTFTGRVEPGEVTALLAEADVFVLASHSEGRPNVVLEAMAAGLPVIASDIPGVSEIVEHEHTGLLFDDGEMVQLARCIETLGADQGLQRRLGEEGRNRILSKGLTWPNCARKYVEVYRELLGA